MSEEISTGTVQADGTIGASSPASSASKEEWAPPGNGLRARVHAFIEDPRVGWFIIGVIVVNAIVLGLQTSALVQGSIGGALAMIDEICLAIFVIELLLRLFARGFRFFLSAWNLFDAVVVGVALVPSSAGLSVLRALRILRTLRLVTRLPSLRLVVQSLLAAIPGVSTIMVLMLLVFYISGVVATTLFGQSFPDWFGTLGESFYTLFQVMTLESWSMGIARPVIAEYPFAWIFFVIFILATTFTVLNLFIAVIVNAMSEEKAAEHQEERQADMATLDVLLAELRSLRGEVAELRRDREPS